jgi:HPt (histidine-containing phosphotransfer) domain-containing protein
MEDSAVQEARQAVAELWPRFRPTIMESVRLLAQATAALEEGRLSDALRVKAEGVAHKLAGSLGTFGFTEGSPLARAIEMYFRADAPLTAAEVADLREKVTALRSELEKPPAV